MARHQKSVDENTIKSIQKDMKSIKHSEFVIKLRAINACYDYLSIAK